MSAAEPRNLYFIARAIQTGLRERGCFLPLGSVKKIVTDAYAAYDRSVAFDCDCGCEDDLATHNSIQEGLSR